MEKACLPVQSTLQNSNSMNRVTNTTPIRDIVNKVVSHAYNHLWL